MKILLANKKLVCCNSGFCFHIFSCCFSSLGLRLLPFLPCKPVFFTEKQTIRGAHSSYHFKTVQNQPFKAILLAFSGSALVLGTLKHRCSSCRSLTFMPLKLSSTLVCFVRIFSSESLCNKHLILSPPQQLSHPQAVLPSQFSVVHAQLSSTPQLYILVSRAAEKSSCPASCHCKILDGAVLIFVYRL